MKQWIFLFVLVMCFSACEKQEIDLYDGGSSIYFDDESAGDYEVSWGTIDSDIKSLKVSLQVNLFGAVTDYARKFKVQVFSDPADSLHSIEGVDYMPLQEEYEMPGNVNHMFIDLVLLRTDTLKKQARSFTIYLIPNDDLGFEYMNYERKDSIYQKLNDHCTIYMDENIPKPWWWNRIGVPLFGTWSITKGILICDIANIDRGVFQGELDGKDGNLSEGYLRFVGRKVYLWLQDNPTLDEPDPETGEERWMEMGVESEY